MLDAIKKYVAFVGVPAGGTAALPHGLVMNGKPLAPDHLGFAGDDSGNFELVSSDTVNITVRNDGTAAGTMLVLAETWHPIERSFGIPPDDGSLGIHLTPRPFVMKSGAGNFGPPTPPIVINVKTLGALGNGVADDRVPIQAAIDLAIATGGAGPVYFPPGVYMVSRAPGTFHSLLLRGDNVAMYGVLGHSVIKQVANVAIGTTSCSLLEISAGTNIEIRDLELNGNWGNAMTTIAAASNGAVLPQAVINVASTAGFPASGTILIILAGGPQTITYTGKTATSFTGSSGGTGTLRGNGDLGRIGNPVGLQSPANTHITAPSDGAVLPQAVINVASTNTFPTSGQIVIGTQLDGDQTVTYTGITPTSFTGASGGTGTIHTDDFVWNAANGINQLTQRDPHNHLIFSHAVGGDIRNLKISRVTFSQAYGDGLWLGGDGTGGGQSGAIGGTQSVTVRDCTFDMCARNGTSLIYGTDFRFEHCNFSNIVTTAIDTEPVNAQVVKVVIDDCVLNLWWNEFSDAFKNALSISGGTVTTPAEWNYAQDYRVTGCRIYGSVFISDAIDVQIRGNTIISDFVSGSAAPILLEEFCDDIWILDNYVYYRNGQTNDVNRGGIEVTRLVVDTVSVMQSANVTIAGNTVHARGSVDGIYVAVPGGGPGFAGVATAITNTTLVLTGAGWTTNEFLGHQVVSGGVVATIASNTPDTLTLATWHADGINGWLDARGQPQSTPAAGSFTIQPTGGVVDITKNTIDCVASDGQPAGRYGIHLTTESTWGVFFNDMRVNISDNDIRGGNPHGVHVFLFSVPAIKYLSICDNFAYDNQFVPTCTHCVFFDNQAGAFDVVAQIRKLVLFGNRTGESVPNNVGGLTSGFWLEVDGPHQQLSGFGSPEGVVTAPLASTFYRRDGGMGTTFYVKEIGGLPLEATARTDRTGDIKAPGDLLNLDAVLTTVDNCLVVQSLVAEPGAGSSNWDQWTNALLTGFAQITQETCSSGPGDFAAAAGALPVAGSSGVGTVRQNAASNEFGNGTYTFALLPQVPTLPPVWIANGTKTEAAAGNVAPPWPAHLENDLGVVLVLMAETDTGATIADPQWIEFTNSPVVGAFSGVGVRMQIFGARAITTSMPAPVIVHGGAFVMAQIMLFRGARNAGDTGWVAF